MHAQGSSSDSGSAGGDVEVDPDLREALMRQVRAGLKAGPTPVIGGEDECDDDGRSPVDPHVRIVGYDVRAELSHGGQGTVYRAVQKSTGRTVAIKVLVGGPYIDPPKRSRFEREAGVLASLRHAAIVGILDRGRTGDGSYFLVMDYVEGVDLERHLDGLAGTAGALRAAVEALARVCEALQEAHGRGIVHRDLKPSNVRVDGHGFPHLLDFGLAHLMPGGDLGERARLTVTGNVLGSLPWASPEQACGDVGNLGPATDVYAVGLLMYRAFTGAMPYATGGMIHETVRNICESTVRPPDASPRQPLGAVDAALSSIVCRCLEKDPSRRYPSAGDVARDLRRWLEGTLVVPAPAPRRGGFSRRRAAVAALAAAGAVAVGGLSFHAWTNPKRVPFAVINLERMTNQVGMEMVRLPSGGFRMGTPGREDGRDARREAPRAVTISRSFFMATTEVTRGHYRAVMGDLPPGCRTAPDDDRWPIDNVSWHEAMEFCDRLGESTGMRYRLPTEAEWEYACRGGRSTPYAGVGKLEEMGWYAGNGDGRVHPVGRKSPNDWGLYDMHGNVAEWCLDAFRESLGAAPATDPFVAASSVDDPAPVRGGHASSPAPDCRSARRDAAGRSTRAYGRGFRVVLAPPPAPATRPAQ